MRAVTNAFIPASNPRVSGQMPARQRVIWWMTVLGVV
jgi:hypothetical protein